MKKIAFLLSVTLLASCSKDSMYKYSYQLSSADKQTMIFEKVPYIATNFVDESQANLQMLDQQTLERWNTKDREKVYRIDTSWIEKQTCMGCKQDWE